MSEEIKKLALDLGCFVGKTTTTLEEHVLMKRKVHEALQKRVRLAINEMRQARKDKAIGDYLHLKRDIDETFGDALKYIGASLAKQVAPNAYRTISGIVKAYRRKKPMKAKVAKVPATPKLKKPASTEPIKVHRKDFAKALKAAGGNLARTKLEKEENEKNTH